MSSDIQAGDVVLRYEYKSWDLYRVLKAPVEGRCKVFPLRGGDSSLEYRYHVEELTPVGGERFYHGNLFILLEDVVDIEDSTFLPAGLIFTIGTGYVKPVMVESPMLMPPEGVPVVQVEDCMVPALTEVFDHFPWSQ